MILETTLEIIFEMMDNAQKWLPNLLSKEGIVASILVFTGGFLCLFVVLCALLCIYRAADTACIFSVFLSSVLCIILRIILNTPLLNFIKTWPEELKNLAIGIFILSVIAFMIYAAIILSKEKTEE